MPGVASADRWPIAWGVIALWTFAIAVFTSWPKRRFARRTWRILHLGSVAGTALAIVHALQLGSDTGTAAAKAVVIALALVGSYALFLRLIGVLTPRR